MKIRPSVPGRLVSLGALALTLLLSVAACGGSGNASASSTVTVHVHDNFFDPNTVTVAPGKAVSVTFINEGSNVHIVEIFGLTSETTLQPGERKSFTITPQNRSYKMYDEIYQSGGMVGAFVGSASAVVASPTVTQIDTLQQAVTAYRAYVIDQGDRLVEQTQAFTDAVIAGDLAKAKSLFAETRQYYERIEPVAESFGDLDPRIDARQGDVPDDQWIGFHRIEQSLWVSNTTAGQEQNARQLLADVKTLRSQMDTLTLTPTDIIDGAVALLDEASTSKITGEEDRYSHTDLSDLVANVEGSQAAFEVFKPFLAVKNPALASDLENQFQRFEQVVRPYRLADGSFTLYSSLTSDQTREIAQAIDAIGEPLSKVGAELV